MYLPCYEQIEMEQNNSATGRQEAGLVGFGGIQNGGGYNDQDFAVVAVGAGALAANAAAANAAAATAGAGGVAVGCGVSVAGAPDRGGAVCSFIFIILPAFSYLMHNVP